MSARYPSDIGVYTNRNYLRSEIPTFAHALGAAGYRCELVGRMHFIGPDQLHGFQHRDIGDISINWPGAPLIDYGKFNSARGTRGPTLKYAGEGETNIHRYDDAVTRGARDRLAELCSSSDEQPFLLLAGWYGPHPPYIARSEDYCHFKGHVPPPRNPATVTGDEHSYLRAWRDVAEFNQVPESDTIRARTAYYANLRMIDREIGKIISDLEASGLADDTVIVYASDHGEQLGERGFWQKNTFFDHSVKVPLVIRWKNHLEAGQIRKEIVNLIDLAATFVEVGGATPLPNASGRSFLKLVTECATEWNNQTFSEFYGGLVSIDTSMIANRMVRDERYKYNHYHGHAPELFDMINDPGETRDLINDSAHHENAERLRDIILNNWNPTEITEQILGKSKDLNLIKQWTEATCPEEFYRWKNSD